LAKVQAKPIKTDEHVFVCGRTGTGKSFLVENYLATYPRVVKQDEKGDALRLMRDGKNPWPQVAPDKLAVVTSLESLHNAFSEGIRTHFIYCANFEEINPEAHNEFYKMCYRLEDITVWVDELFAVSPNPHVIPEYLQAIYTRGRTRNVSAWGLTQRPKGISGMPLSQATHVFGFDLRKPEDRKYMYDTTGAPEFMENPGKYNFWYWTDEMDNAIKARIALSEPKVVPERG